MEDVVGDALLVVDLLKVVYRLRTLQIAAGLVQRTEHIGVELLHAHVHHRFGITELRIEQHQKACHHKDANGPNQPTFHTAKIRVLLTLYDKSDPEKGRF